jgi:hypothetical protein
MRQHVEQNQAEKGTLPLNPSASDPIKYVHDVLCMVENRLFYFVTFTNKAGRNRAPCSME